MTDSRDIKDLHPTLQRALNELIRRCNVAGINICITSTYRDNEYQNKLYAKGRTAPGKIVTNAKGGQSIHNYRLAFDFAPYMSNRQIDWSGRDPQWVMVGEIGMGMGLEWGGSWKGFADRPHFQFINGLTLKQLQKGATLPENFKMKWEIEMEKEIKPIDNTPSPWAKDVWEWGKKKGITDGNNPKGTATREQVVAMLRNAIDPI